MDKCPKCDIELFREEGKYKSDEGSTDVYLEHTLKCRNPQCENYNQVVSTEPIKVN